MNIVVYCGSTGGIGEKYLDSARALGKWIGESGNTLVYGGASKGLMGAVCDATLEAGGKVIGVLPNVPRIQERRHQGLTEYVDTQSMAERKAKMIELADAFVALPGGIGTLDELTDVLSLASLDITNCPIVLFDTDGYYQPFKAVLRNIVENGFGLNEYFSGILFSEDMKEISEFILRK